MRARQLKLGAAPVGVGGPGQQNIWRSPEIPGDASVNIGFYQELVAAFEAARLDFVFVVDSQFITQHSPPHYLNRLEPLTLLSALAISTSNIGLVGTLTTSYNAPFNVARRLASLDLISHGRAGWNVVTSGDPGTAGNYSRDEHYDHATRYARAHEHVAVVRGLWDSYEDDAFPRDRRSGLFFDPARQHALNHRGEFFSVVGPLNISRSPQGQPVIFQAGDSDDGRRLGAAVGEGVFTIARSFEDNRAFYRDLKGRAEALGRDPGEMVIMAGAGIRIADTDEQAWRIEDAIVQAKDFDKVLAEFGRPFGWHDFSQYDLDAPFPDVAGLGANSFRSHSEHIVAVARERNLTLRETVVHFERSARAPFVGSAQTVADELERWFVGHAVDGFIIFVTVPSDFQRFANEVLPILRDRGLFRREYEATTLRGNLGLPIPENVHTAARAAAPAGHRAGGRRAGRGRAATAVPTAVER